MIKIKKEYTEFGFDFFLNFLIANGGSCKLSFKANIILTVISEHITFTDLSSKHRGSHAIGISMTIYKNLV